MNIDVATISDLQDAELRCKNQIVALSSRLDTLRQRFDELTPSDDLGHIHLDMQLKAKTEQCKALRELFKRRLSEIGNMAMNGQTYEIAAKARDCAKELG